MNVVSKLLLIHLTMYFNVINTDNIKYISNLYLLFDKKKYVSNELFYNIIIIIRMVSIQRLVCG